MAKQSHPISPSSHGLPGDVQTDLLEHHRPTVSFSGHDVSQIALWKKLTRPLSERVYFEDEVNNKKVLKSKLDRVYQATWCKGAGVLVLGDHRHRDFEEVRSVSTLCTQ